MAGKKGAPKALQTEVNTDEEWNEILQRPGLVVVDVYSDWSGPCAAMTSTLRKIKLEIAGDSISYAVAKNDEISDLVRFRGKSEPVWMVIQDGNMVNLMFGSHCPDLKSMLLKEIQRTQEGRDPEWSIPVTQRSPEEEVRWQKEEAIRLALEEEKAAMEEEDRKIKYENYLDQMMYELCEETAVLLFPWVFLDEDGRAVDKERCPPYSELRNDLFIECFDIVEEARVELNEETIEKMFVESEMEITDDLIKSLTMGKCLVLRVRGRPPHPDWPVPYPSQCEKGKLNCPVRAINDVENYLLKIIHDQPPPLISTTVVRRSFEEPFFQRHVLIVEADPEQADDKQITYPAVWVPPQARSKVHVFKTIFSFYMTRAHPYEEPPPPLPLCAFKFAASTFEIVRETCSQFAEAILCIGLYEFDKPPIARRLASSVEDFVNRALKTGREILVLVVTRVNEETFLSFAGIEPYFICEDQKEITQMLQNYFRSDTVDFLGDSESDEMEEEGFYSEMMDAGEFYYTGEEEDFEYGIVVQ